MKPRAHARPLALARFVAVAAVASGALAACGSSGDEASGTRIVATTPVLADIASEVAGPDAEVVQLIPDGADPHSFALSAGDRLELEQDDLVVANGAGLEAGIPLDETDARVWELASEVDELLAGEGGDDPHVWMDPTRVAGALGSFAAALGEADPVHARGYEDRAAAYADQLRDLDREISKTLDAVPAGDRELITSHDSLAYFADRYGFEVVATAFPASGAESEASAERLADVATAVRETRVAAVFAEQSDNPDVLGTVADESGVTVEPGLLVESPGDAGSYEEMLRRDAELIANALG